MKRRILLALAGLAGAAALGLAWLLIGPDVVPADAWLRDETPHDGWTLTDD